MFSFTMTVGDVRPGLVGCLARLGGVPETLVFDNDASIVAPAPAANLEGQVERTIGYLETRFLPARSFDSLVDLQGQHDTWATDVAARRTLRRTGPRVGDRWVVERGFLRVDVEAMADAA